MPFRGSRGASRGRGPGPKAFGGRRGGRGGKSSQGRGAFGSSRGKQIFNSSRLAQEKEGESNEKIGSECSSNGEPESRAWSSDEDDVNDLVPAMKPYLALMQTLSVEAGPQGKRRKLDNQDQLRTTVRASIDRADHEFADDADDVDQDEDKQTTRNEFIEDADSDGEDTEDRSDPFEIHFANPDKNILAERLDALKRNQWSIQNDPLPSFGKSVLCLPRVEHLTDCAVETISGPEDLKLKHKLAGVMSTQSPCFDALEKSIAPSIFNYQDVLFCERDPNNSESLRRLTSLHAVNHVFKTRARVIKNNARLSKETSKDLDLRDQGFTRPKVLIILPTRESCVRTVNMINILCEPGQQENRKRFDDSYSDRNENLLSERSKDFSELFGGNDDDMFRLGLKFTRKSIKYFSEFYNSDIIFASPLGLRMALEGKESRQGDSDFLSSIEMVIIDHADALLMQNWEHVEYIFEHLNLQPKEAHGCDFSRVRNWYLDNNAKYFRQTIVLAAFNTPELNTMFFHQSRNWAGKIKIHSKYPGAIQDLGYKIKQTLSRLESPSFATDPDTRFVYFTTAVIPALTRRSSHSAGTLIFIPSYLDFVRVRNLFTSSPAASSLTFGSISEYTSVRDVARARSHFFNGRHNILLYTERAHHFRRFQLRGVKKIIMYGLPDNPVFYKEIVGGYLGRSLREGILEPGEGSVRVLFSKWDILKLERVVGTERVGKMIRDKGDTFEFL